MEAAPPPYDEKTSLAACWTLVANHLTTNDLCSAALTCKSWHATVTPFLWGNPTSHLKRGDDQAYFTLSRFRRALHICRPTIRSLTHTLHFRSQQTESYEDFHPGWLLECLEHLPNLQSLIVRGLSCFDHAALEILTSARRRRCFSATTGVSPSIHSRATFGVQVGQGIETYRHGLRLLDASRCFNLTCEVLSEALSLFGELVYLDLSFTTASRSPVVLQALHGHSKLQVLKLRGIDLTDDALGVLARSIGRRVRSVDLRNNRISDRGIAVLQNECLTPVGSSSSSCIHHIFARSDDSDFLHPCLGSRMLEIYQGEDFEAFLLKTLKTAFVGRLALEDVTESSITHLYVSGNRVTTLGVLSLVKSAHLHVLDLGDVLFRNDRGNDGSAPRGQPAVAMPGLLYQSTQATPRSLTFLRIDHRLLINNVGKQVSEEIPTQAEVVANTRTGDARTADACGINPLGVKHDASGIESHKSHKRLESFPSPQHWSLSNRQHLIQFDQSDSSKISSQSTVDGNGVRGYVPCEPGPHVFHPSMISGIRVLVLTNVPPVSQNEKVSQFLIQLIEHCANERWTAIRQASLDYSVPPGREGLSESKEDSARRQFALRRIVLEMAADQSPTTQRLERWPNSNSVTEDPDSENLWLAAKADFSFFDEREDCKASTADELVVSDDVNTTAMSRNASNIRGSSEGHQRHHSFDTLAILSAFRHERKRVHEAVAYSSSSTAETFGHWDGTIQIVRINKDVRIEEEADYLGSCCIEN